MGNNMWIYLKITRVINKYLGENTLKLYKYLSLFKLSTTDVSIH